MFKEFIMDNFFYLHPGYTTFNTIIFGLVLGLIILGIIKIFEKINKDPLDLIYPLIPIIIFGSTTRALVDNHIYPRIRSRHKRPLQIHSPGHSPPKHPQRR